MTRPTLALLLLAAAGSLHAQTRPPNLLVGQFGAGGKGTTAYTVGYDRDWSWTAVAYGHWSGATELLAGRWRAAEPGRYPQWITQIGVSPMLRWSAPAWRRAFLEAGIGADWITPRYASDSRRFSTRFQFADHIAWGTRVGTEGLHELSVRIEHFSNADIRSPNPGEEFIEFRYGYRF